MAQERSFGACEPYGQRHVVKYRLILACDEHTIAQPVKTNNLTCCYRHIVCHQQTVRDL